jgi:hypothetical protein
LAAFGLPRVLGAESAATLWDNVLGGAPVANGETVWRVHVPASRAEIFVMEAARAGCEWLLDWAGACAWVGAPVAANLRRITVAHGGHAMLLTLLAAAGFRVREPAEPHLCCGSAGTYNILQPELARQLGDRKGANLAKLRADVVATGNVGCATQLQARIAVPVVHTVELLDWATVGPPPTGLANKVQEAPMTTRLHHG